MTPNAARNYLREVIASEAPATPRMTRRTIAAIITLFPTIIVACQTGNLSTAVADAELVIGGFQKVLPGLLAAGVITQAQYDQATTWLATAQHAVASLGSVNGITAGQVFLSAVENILSMLAGLPMIPAPWNALVAAASVLVPIIAAALGLQPPPAAAKLMARFTTAMSEEAARATLRGQRSSLLPQTFIGPKKEQ